jgi:hypothetical protein
MDLNQNKSEKCPILARISKVEKLRISISKYVTLHIVISRNLTIKNRNKQSQCNENIKIND